MTFKLTYLANVLLMTGFCLSFRFADLVSLLGGTETLAGTIVGLSVAIAIAVKLKLGEYVSRRGLQWPWFGLGAAFTLGATLLAANSESVALLWMGRALFVGGYAGCLACGFIFIQSLVPAAKATETVAVYGSSTFLGLILGPLISDLIVNFIDSEIAALRLMFTAAAGMGFFHTLIAINVGRRYEKPQGGEKLPFLKVMRGFRFGPIVVAALALGACFSIPQLFLASYIKHIGLEAYTLFFAAYAPAAFVFRLLSRKWADRIGRYNMVMIGLIGFALAQFSYLGVSNIYLLIIPGILTGFGRASIEPSLITLGADSVPIRYRAIGTAAILVFIDVGLMVLAPVMGFVLDQLGFTAMFVAAGTSILAIAAWTGIEAMLAGATRSKVAGTPSVFAEAGDRARVLITGRLHPFALDYLTANDGMMVHYAPDCSRRELLDKVTDADVLLCRIETKVNREVLDRAANLKLVGTATTGTDHIDRDQALANGIGLFHCPGRNANAVSEFAIGALIDVCRNISNAAQQGDLNLRHQYEGRELRGRSIGIWGFGQIGQKVASLAEAMGMKVFVYEQTNNPMIARKGYQRCYTLKDLAEASEILSIHVPLTLETFQRINSRIIEAMPRGAYIVNTSRGEILVESDIKKALDTDHLAGLASDDNWDLRDHPRCLCTPHIGSLTAEAQLETAKAVVAHLNEAYNRRTASERRATPVSSPLNLSYVRDDEMVEGQVTDVSHKGIGVATQQPLDHGATVRFDSAKGPLEFRVAWTSQATSDEYQSGLELLTEFEGLPALFSPGIRKPGEDATPEELRENPRLGADEEAPVTARILGTDVWVQHSITDVSRHGLGLATDRYIAPQTEIDLQYDGKVSRFIVRWCRGHADHGYRCGLQITDYAIDLNNLFAHLTRFSV